MTKKIAWITDTAAQLEKSFIQKYNVHILPLSVVFADGVFRETVDMTQEEFYDKLRVAKVHPKTSQPAIGDMVSLYKKLQEQGYDCAIAVHVSSDLSGTFDSSQTAAQMVDFKVYSIDSKIGSYPMIKMIEIGNELLESGHDVEEVVTAIKKITKNSELSFIPANLNQLHKSGRVSGTKAFISNLLNIKVVITFDDGKPVMTEKVRANKRAKKHVTALLCSDMKKGNVPEVAVINCNNTKDAESWKDELMQEFPKLKVLVLPLSACVGVHAGEGTTGLSWVRY
ncbi:DegV family protein [Sporosarcina sp. ANT_H38]|uniref:DegV family protein n=1 Tax=Sporosarcina sp. ANT_H38 TaxID=2597358 RepID=UPI0011F1E584|nr:DegV family protein [Sporosarcina sp. ANT_H38]KAA0966106.1 DegV family protein [Sporosarcina sp. ANT_H38]